MLLTDGDNLMNYKILKNYEFKDGPYFLKPIELNEIEDIRKWRNAQKKYLRQRANISREEQFRYFNNFVFNSLNENEPRQILFSYFFNSDFIGYGGLVHISWHDKRAEISFLLKKSLANSVETYQTHFKKFLDLIKIISFQELKLNKLFTETYNLRPFHILTLEEAGFRLEGRLKNHVFIEGKFIDSLIHGLDNSEQ